jgi:N-acetylgalactosamine-6-sulfatase
MRQVSLLLAFLTFVLPVASLAHDAETQPNILFILADDLGYGDLACYGRKDIETPNLDRLAREGVLFRAHYANGPECTPTRTAFLTGRYPQWVGGLECAIGTGNVGRYDDAIRLASQSDLGLPAEEQTIVRILQRAGYATAITGKWHLGYEPKFAPHLHGFDYTFYCIGGGMDYFHFLDKVASYCLFQDGNPIKRDGYFTDLMTDEAIRFMERNRGVPFFLYVPYTAPHSPFQGPNDFRPDPLPLDSILWNQSNAPPRIYIEMIQHMDRSIGRILRALERLGLSRQTLVLFASDNGGTRSARNDPFSNIKGSTFEGGIRVPALVRWPGVVPAGVVSDQVCATFDFTVSIANAARVKASSGKPFEGMDIVAHVARGRKNFERTLYWRKPRGDTVWKGVRHGGLKYIGERHGNRYEEYLFDLSSDPSELTDLKDKRPKAFARLKELYYSWELKVRQNRRGRPE